MYGSNRFLNARCYGTEATASGKWFKCLTTLHGELFLPVWWNSNQPLSPGLLMYLNSWFVFSSILVVKYLVGKDQIISQPSFSRYFSLRALNILSYVRLLRLYTYVVFVLRILSREWGKFVWRGHSQCGLTGSLYRGMNDVLYKAHHSRYFVGNQEFSWGGECWVHSSQQLTFRCFG